MAEQHIKTDGVYRPEPWLDGARWIAVAYTRGVRSIDRTVHGDRIRGRFFATYFDSEAKAQAVCDRINARGK